MNINEYFAANPGHTRPPIRTPKRTLSVQASRHHYCSPKADTGPYSSVEVLVVDGPHPREFFARRGRCEDGVYGWVPVSVVEAVIAKDGGDEAFVRQHYHGETME